MYEEGWLYLATVKDIFTKEVVGWAVADSVKTTRSPDSTDGR